MTSYNATLNNVTNELKKAKIWFHKTANSLTKEFNSTAHDIARFIPDWNPIGEDIASYRNLTDVYAWTAYTLLITGLISKIFALIFGAVFQLFFVPAGSAVMAVIILPSIMIWFIPKLDIGEEERRMWLIPVSVLIGILVRVTMNLSQTQLMFYPPPLVILPLSVTVVVIFVGPAVGNQSRAYFYAVILGLPLMLYIAYGIIAGSTCADYVVWVISLIIVSFVDIQIKLGMFREGQHTNARHQAVTIVTFLCTTAVMTYFACAPIENKVENVNTMKGLSSLSKDM